MTRIDFYVLSSPRPESRLQFACRLTRKAWEQNRRVYLHCANEAEAKALDELLWAFRADSFLPHAMHADQPDEKVVCGYGDDPAPHNDLLINLSNDTPAFFSRFNRLAEILIEHDPVLVSGRERFRSYREQGYPPNTHQIRTAG